jgi:hypothetical protein
MFDLMTRGLINAQIYGPAALGGGRVFVATGQHGQVLQPSKTPGHVPS